MTEPDTSPADPGVNVAAVCLIISVALASACRKAPSDAPHSPATRTPSAQNNLAVDCREHAGQVAGDLGDGYAVIVRPPFVVAGDLGKAGIRQSYEQTIGPAARAMATAYFDTPPQKPITILLFQNDESYRREAKRLYGDEDVSRFGYYKPHLRTLLMNIGTGSGTLVHELTHALIAFDFPGAPDWLNEGLASLHEQCTVRADGSGIDGRVNWRLPKIHQAIREDRLRPLRELIESDDFYGPLENLNYAHARYFCLYMQEQGVLGECYRKARTGHDEDPSGSEAVGLVFADRTWDELDADFRRWVMDLQR